jgi:hypothetical protein
MLPSFAAAVDHAEEAKKAEEAAPMPAAESSTAVAAGTPQPPKVTGIKKGPRPQGRGAGAGRIETPAESAPIHRPSDEVTPWRRVRWVLLAAIPSSLMLGITTHITTDLSPIPLFWLIPLTLYLLSFILVFARWPVVWTEEPHKVMLYAQPAAIGLMLLMDFMAVAHSYVWMSIFFHVLGFFFTVMVCHGELAKDRPSTRYLTEFYLWMSVGGMVGGMFNALIAPVIFDKLIELGVAIFAACLIRPVMRESGWLDDLLAGVLESPPEAPAPGPKVARAGRHHTIAKSTASATPTMSYSLDVMLAFGVMILAFGLAFGLDPMRRDRDSNSSMMIAFGIPLFIACLFYARPLRFGLAIGAVMLVNSFYTNKGDSTEYAARSFFGIISVKQSEQDVRLGGEEKTRVAFRQLIHGHINHGMNFIKPKDEKEWGNPRKDFSRLATTYYHRLGPAGRVMEQYNWFHPRDENNFSADARMPASLIGQLAGGIGFDPVPYNAFADLWSEPPFATVGLGTGTMASYGRPFQHVHYYEIDNQIKRLSLPEKGSGDQVYFTYLKEALNRGCDVQVHMGDARLRMALPYRNYHEEQRDPGSKPGGGPEAFYHMMVVDAFSSDAIPAHLLTEEALRSYRSKLAPGGLLAVHVTNRHLDLVPVVAAEADELGMAAVVREDGVAPDPASVSTWVVLAREQADLDRLLTRPGWEPAVAGDTRGWTDDYSSLVQVLDLG